LYSVSDDYRAEAADGGVNERNYRQNYDYNPGGDGWDKGDEKL
jgi:hypothetical protein